MYVLKKAGGNSNIAYQEFVCDDLTDMNSINIKTCTMGSTCYVINTGATYVLNSQKEWRLKITNSSGSTSGSIPSPDDNYVYDGGEEV